MVVTRRTPVPAPPVSRTQSSQGQLRSSRAAEINDAYAPPHVSSPLAMGDAHPAASTPGNSSDSQQYNDKDEHKKLKKKTKSRKSAKKKCRFIRSFFDFLTKLILLAFTIYTFSVCPRDEHLQSPICRGLSEYKRIVLDPYVIPPVKATLAHPSVVPYVERVTEVTSPIILRTQTEWNRLFIPQWEQRIVPAWNNRIIPAFQEHVVTQWQKRVVPRYESYIAPQLSKLEPYATRVESFVEQAEATYTTRIAPHMRIAIYNLQRWRKQAQPYIILAIQRTHDYYHATKPYVIPLVKGFVAEMQRVILFLREQRRIFVDPHVAKLWEKVKELSSGSPAATTSASVLFAATEFPSPELDISETLETVLNHVSAVLPTQLVVETDPPINEVAETSAMDAGTPRTEERSSTTVFREPATLGTSSYVTASSAASSTVTESISIVTSVFPTDIDELSSSIAPTAPTGPILSVASTPILASHISDDDEIDIGAFYAELGLDEPLTLFQSQEQVPLNPPESEEERAERIRRKAEETARKRADIEARHSKWEAELQSQMEIGRSTLKPKLEVIRNVAAGELVDEPEIREAIESLVADAEKYIKGAEVYLKNLKSENRKNDEKMSLWERVLDKVGVKFSERLGVVEAVVNTWYGVILDQELDEVALVTAEVREVAEKAQVDLGLDYAWLEEVTYSDWQRYHSLIDASDKFTLEAKSIQNGMHPSLSVDNPIVPIFEDLESEVHDVVIGFETRLRRIKRDGERAFNSVQKDEKGITTEHDVEPEVSILPIPEQGESGQDFVPPVIIGRSKEEVLEALGKVEPLQEATSGSSTDEDAGEVVSSLVREAEEERLGHSAIPHTEL